jgi:glyoxylase-like metal-dependent hydrolase (beta-lactamase superfamily II)
MAVTIHSFTLGFSESYLIEGDGVVMIDCGVPKREKSFRRALDKFSLKPEQIRLVIITHGHWDHIGSAKRIKEITGAQVAMHRLDKDCLEQSLKRLPPGLTLWGSIFMKSMALFKPLIRIEASEVDLVIDQDDLALADYGIPGKVIHTPGHTPGSVSVLLETGDAFVGDIAVNWFPLCLRPRLAALGDDLDQVKESWRLLLGEGAATVHPGHGKPFSADVIRKALA